MNALVSHEINIISIHPPLAGRDMDNLSNSFVTAEFQSTRPLRDGTDIQQIINTMGKFQSTRPLRDGTGRGPASRPDFVISIHPPLAGRDILAPYPFWIKEISIHPPLAGRDKIAERNPSIMQNFNPPAPCGTGPRSS